MNRKLESHVVVAPVVGLLALSIALLVVLPLLPGWAQAQEEQEEEYDVYTVYAQTAQPNADRNDTTQAQEAVAAATSQRTAHQPTERLVVEPGDSLWSIAQGRLGPSAPPWQVANEVELIYGLNRSTIGDDPNLIFPGQQFSLPPVGEPPAVEPAAPDSATAAAHATPESADEPTTPEPEERAAEQAAPEEPVAPSASPSPNAANNSEPWISILGRAHWLLGSGILLLASILTLFLAWKAYGVRRSLRRDPKRRYHAPSIELGGPEGEQQRFPLLRAPRLEGGPSDLEDTATAEKGVLQNGARDRLEVPVADYARHKKVRRMRASNPTRRLRSEATARVYSPLVRRYLRRPFGTEVTQEPRRGGRRWR